MRFGVVAAAATTVVALSPVARALEVQTQVSSRRVSVGESFYVQLSVTSDAQGHVSLSNPSLPLPAGMSATGPNATQTSSSFGGIGGMRTTAGLTLSWTVTATKVGSFKVGPPSVMAGSERLRGQPVQIEVVPGDPQRQRHRAADPFDLLNQLGRGGSFFPPGFGGLLDDDPSEARPEEPSVPEDFKVDKAPDPLAFLRSTMTPTQVVVGEQVNLQTYAYGARGPFDFAASREASHADFLAFPVMAEGDQFVRVPVGGTTYIARKLTQPLFPLHAGTLRAGNVKLGFAGRGYTNQLGQSPDRESNWVDLIVTEPPLKGRPPGYKIGDVGQYALSATIEPRQIAAGDAVSVVATLSGVGNVPYKIQNPESHGVEWLEPALTEKVDTPNAVVKGSRTFSYVVRLSEPGNIDLGELTLPYYDPKRRAYAVARASLGTIEVQANPKSANASAPKKPLDRLEGVLKPRAQLGASPAAAAPLGDRTGFWAAILLAPFSVVFAGAALSLATRTREKLRERGSSLTAQLEGALREARELAKRDTQGSVAAVERAVFLAIELKLNLKARAILKTELAARLTERGLPSARAKALARLLEDCDSLRFVGAESGIEPAELAERAAQNAAEMRDEKLSAAS